MRAGPMQLYDEGGLDTDFEMIEELLVGKQLSLNNFDSRET